MRLAPGLCFVLAGLAAAASALLAQAGPGGSNLIANGDFAGSSTAPWSTIGGTLSVSGEHTGAIAVTFSSAHLSQPVALVPGQTYRFTGRFVDSQNTIVSVEPGVIVLEEGGGQQTNQLNPPLASANVWSLDTQISCAGTSALVRVTVTGESGATAYLDDLALEAIDPLAPCPTATPAASDTPVVTATPTRTATPQTGEPTQTATASASPTRTATPTLTPSNGLLVNGGFEAADGGAPAGWDHFGGTLTRAGQPVRTGAAAACLDSATSSTKWLYQTVAIAPGAWYELSAYIYDNDRAVDAAWLRLSWYESDDGSGGTLWTADSTEVLDAPQAVYRLLTTGVVQAPTNARSANARVLLRPASGAPARICVDDISLIGAAPPPTATPTVTPSATAPSDAATQAAPSATATPTRTPAALGATAGPTLTATWTRQPVAPTATSTPAPWDGLLVNGGFESGVDGWGSYGGDLAAVTWPVGSGQYAGAFVVESGNTSWAYQAVAVEPGGWYELSAYIYESDANVAAAFLRVSWYASRDGGGSAIDSVDSIDFLDTPQPAYRALTTGPVQAPPDAHSAKARIMLRPRAPGAATIYIDDMLFRPSTPPSPPDGPPAADTLEASAPNASTTNRATGGTSSQVQGIARAEGALGFAPQPTPVIRRAGLAVSADAPPPPDREVPSWAWVLGGGVIAAFVAGGGTAWWEGRAR